MVEILHSSVKGLPRAIGEEALLLVPDRVRVPLMQIITELIAHFLLSYPIIYSVIIIPLSVVRWIQFGQETKGKNYFSPTSTLTVESVFHLGGFLDVSLFFLLPRDLLLFQVRNTHARVLVEEEPIDTTGELSRLDVDGELNDT